MGFREWLLNLLGCREKYYFDLYGLTLAEKNRLEIQLQQLIWDEGKKPDWLDDSKIPYEPLIEIEGEQIKLKPQDIYMESRTLRDLATKWRELTLDEKLKEIWKIVITRLTYKYDKAENWLPPIVAYERRYGDCFSSEEEIWTNEGTKKIKDLKLGDKVLSYDFDKKQYCYKPIINIWGKGKLPIKRVHFRNGQYIDITDNHHLFVRNSQKESKYEKTELKNVDLERWWKRKIPCVKTLFYLEKDVEWLNNDLCFIIGHYIAEGWHEGSHICTSGYDCNLIAEKLEQLNIPFSEGMNGYGIPTLTFLKSDLKEFLKKCGNNAFDKQIPEEMMNLPKEKLQSLMNGYFLGDGHYSGEYYNYPTKVINYSTSSKKLAYQIQEIHLKLGKPIHLWKQLNHRGYGRAPIWRLRYNSNSHFCKDYDYEGLSEVSISYIEDMEEIECRDFEIEDTHLVIFKNGIITSQCEDGTILFVTLARIAHVQADRVFNACGFYTNSSTGEKFGHSYVIAKMQNNEWYIFETTLDSIPNSPKLFKGSNYDASWGVANWKFAGKLKEGIQL